jgi:tetratricopeptide (TPR) repeat protein
MESKFLKSLTAAVFVISFLNTSINAQVRGDVIKVYNEGAKAIQTDVQAAIKAFESVITLSDQVGETANDLKQKAMQVLPGLYVKSATNAITEKKPSPEIVRAAKTAVAAAEKYGTDANKETAQRVLLQAYYAMGTDYFSKKDYENALLAFDSLLVINP